MAYSNFTRAALHLTDPPSSSRITPLVSWIPPPAGCLKLNSDGSVHHLGNAAAGGLIRDDLGHWIQGYSVNIGITSPFEAELWGLVHGLKVALSLNIPDLLVDLDSAALVDLFANPPSPHRATSNLMLEGRHLLSLFASVTFRHTFREGNQAADFLANFGHSIEPGLLIHHAPPTGIGPILLGDKMETMFPRH